MKTHPEALKILVALAKDAREELHWANKTLRTSQATPEGHPEHKENLEIYLDAQDFYVHALNALALAKSAVGRK